MGKKGSGDGPAEEMGEDRGVNGKRGRVKQEKASDSARKQKEPALRLLVPHGPLLDPAPGQRAREATRFCAAPGSVRGGGGRGGLSGHAAPPPWRARRRRGLRDPPHPRLGSQRAPRALHVAVAFNLPVPRLGEGALGLRCRVPSLLRSLPPHVPKAERRQFSRHWIRPTPASLPPGASDWRGHRGSALLRSARVSRTLYLPLPPPPQAGP